MVRACVCACTRALGGLPMQAPCAAAWRRIFVVCATNWSDGFSLGGSGALAGVVAAAAECEAAPAMMRAHVAAEEWKFVVLNAKSSFSDDYFAPSSVKATVVPLLEVEFWDRRLTSLSALHEQVRG